MATIKLNEEQLYQLIQESIEKTMLEEGRWDYFKAGWNGLKQGISTQHSLDKDNSNLKRHWDREDFAQQAHGLTSPENTAAMEANKLYNQFKEYRQIANKLLAKRNQLITQYGLVVNKETKMCTDPTKAPSFGDRGIAGSMRKSGIEIASAPGRDTRPVGIR
jgi:hypothetical protein